LQKPVNVAYGVADGRFSTTSSGNMLMAEKPPRTTGSPLMAAAPGVQGGRTFGGRLVRIAFWGLLALLLATAGTVFIASRTMTLQWAAQQATRFTDGRLQIEGITGSVLSEVAADALRWRDGDVAITLTSPRLTYHPLALLDGIIRVERIHAADVQVDLAPVPPGQPRPPFRLPEALTAMLPTAIERLDAGRVVVRRGPDELVRLYNLEAVFRHDGDRFNASLLNADIVTGESRTAARGEVAVLSRAPYATDGRFALRSPMQPEPLRMDLRINGPLEELSVRATTAIAGAPVEARTVLRPLDSRPLRQVRVDVKDFDLSRYDATLPATRLTGSYDAEVMPAWAKESKPLLIGPLSVVNAMPVPLTASGFR
jgi:autotransporter translocation and assembly factor TamB